MTGEGVDGASSFVYQEGSASASEQNLMKPSSRIIPMSLKKHLRKFLSARHTADRIAATILIVVNVLIFNTSVSYGLFQAGQPGPGLFPATIAGGLVALSVLWFVMGARTTGPANDSQASADSDDGHLNEAASEDPYEDLTVIDKAGVRIIAFALLWALVPLLLLDRIGFILTTTVYVGGMLVIVGRARAWIAFPITAGASLLTAFAANSAGIHLPDPLNLLAMLGM